MYSVREVLFQINFSKTYQIAARLERTLRQVQSDRAEVEDINEKKRRLFRSLRTKFIAAQIKYCRRKRPSCGQSFVYHNTK